MISSHQALERLVEVVEDFLTDEYPNGTDHPADASAARLSRAWSDAKDVVAAAPAPTDTPTSDLCTCPNRDTLVGGCPVHGDKARLAPAPTDTGEREPTFVRSRRNDDGTIDLWYSDGSHLTARPAAALSDKSAEAFKAGTGMFRSHPDDATVVGSLHNTTDTNVPAALSDTPEGRNGHCVCGQEMKLAKGRAYPVIADDCPVHGSAAGSLVGLE